MVFRGDLIWDALWPEPVGWLKEFIWAERKGKEIGCISLAPSGVEELKGDN